MSIKSTITELKELDQEISRLAVKLKSLRDRKKEIETDIVDYLDQNDLPGIKYKKCGIVIKANRNAKQTIRKPKGEKMSNATDVLKNYGIDEPEKILGELLQAMQGEKKSITKIKVVDFKE